MYYLVAIKHEYSHNRTRLSILGLIYNLAADIFFVFVILSGSQNSGLNLLIEICKEAYFYSYFGYVDLCCTGTMLLFLK